MRSHESRMDPSSNLTGVLAKTGYEETDTCTQREHHVKSQGEDSHLQGKGYQRLPAAHRSQERGRGQTLPQGPQRESTLLTPWFQTTGPQNCETINSYCFKPRCLWYFVMAALENEYNREYIYIWNPCITQRKQDSTFTEQLILADSYLEGLSI